ncbi:MAG: nickel-dependent hydrogenase large subunit [Myxococcales bacterium]|nr:nickel-dependent hydrogenase large subunit [Myxococcales bacterium]
MTEERTYKVEMLARVEGEGRFTLRTEGERVVEARLEIFEAPRFFEAFLRGRRIEEVPDIVARICGICPIAYQMSAVAAIESALGHVVPVGIRDLRRLMYCGEWIESHALHVFLLHAPDFLGYPSAVEMAADHREIVERGLALKKAGNRIIELLGGRAVHPVSVRVGGFSRVPTPRELAGLLPELRAGLAAAEEAVEWAASLRGPRLEPDYVFMALRDDRGRYPLEGGDAVVVSGRDPVPLAEFEAAFVESQVEHSNALQCRLADGTPYLTGPLARLHHHAERLHPRARAVMEAVGLPPSVRDPYRSVVVRAVEIVHAFAEAIDLVEAYVPVGSPGVTLQPRDAVGFGATEAPRGVCWHRYDLRADGTVEAAKIVPPTSQNQARIEQDLVGLAPQLLALPHDEATHRCEQLIRSYDPCISCATHFLRLDIERRPEASP